jgi:hypothetical protein
MGRNSRIMGDETNGAAHYPLFQLSFEYTRSGLLIGRLLVNRVTQGKYPDEDLRLLGCYVV